MEISIIGNVYALFLVVLCKEQIETNFQCATPTGEPFEFLGEQSIESVKTIENVCFDTQKKCVKNGNNRMSSRYDRGVLVIPYLFSKYS